MKKRCQRFSKKSNRSKESQKMSQNEHFSDVLKKMKAGKKTKLKIKTDDNIDDLEKQEKKRSQFAFD